MLAQAPFVRGPSLRSPFFCEGQSLRTLTRIEYWDRAGGGRIIVLETSTTNEVRTRKWMRAAQKGLKMSCIHPFGHHNWTRIIFGKPWFWPAFEPFVVPNWPIFKALSALRGAKIAQHGLKMGSFPLFVHPQIVQKYLWENTFLIHF